MPPTVARYSCLTGRTYRSLRIVTIASDNKLLCVRVMESSLSLILDSDVLIEDLIPLNLDDAWSSTTPFSSMHMLIACSQSLRGVIPSAKSFQIGGSLASGAKQRLVRPPTY